MCFADENIFAGENIFQVFFCLKVKGQCFDFLYKGKDFNVEKKNKIKTQIYLSTKCG